VAWPCVLENGLSFAENERSIFLTSFAALGDGKRRSNANGKSI
jgi:hypothetical protein